MEIDLGAVGFGLDFHPSQHLLATSLINGDLHLYGYTPDSDSDSSLSRVREIHAHTESCRAARFIDLGQRIVTASADRSILATDVETGTPVARLENAHEESINALISLTESTIASGDDNGCIKVWDTRQRSCSMEFSAHEDYVSDFTFASDSVRLFSTSGDGTMAVCNLRTKKIQSRSEFSEEELLSVVIMKNGRKVISGTQNGNLLLYSWGYFKDCSDRFTEISPNSIDVLLKLDEDRVITGCDNGIISLVGILPNRIIQTIGALDFPVEDLAFSYDKRFLGSTSDDSTLKLWDLDDILQGAEQEPNDKDAPADSDSDNDDEMDVDIGSPKSKKGTKRKKAGKGNATGSNSTNFFADLS